MEPNVVVVVERQHDYIVLCDGVWHWQVAKDGPPGDEWERVKECDCTE